MGSERSQKRIVAQSSKEDLPKLYSGLKKVDEAEVVTLDSMFKEMRTWFDVSSQEIEAAKKSGINTKNNKEFNKLVLNWHSSAIIGPKWNVYDLLRSILSKSKK